MTGGTVDFSINVFMNEYCISNRRVSASIVFPLVSALRACSHKPAGGKEGPLLHAAHVLGLLSGYMPKSNSDF